MTNQAIDVLWIVEIKTGVIESIAGMTTAAALLVIGNSDAEIIDNVFLPG